jgi:hypothetical protein
MNKNIKDELAKGKNPLAKIKNPTKNRFRWRG